MSLRLRFPGVRMACLPVFAVLALALRAQTLTFTATALGTYGSADGLAVGGVSSAGVVVATAYEDGTPTAVSWISGAGWVSLGLNGGPQTSSARAISPDGTYVLGSIFLPGSEDPIEAPYRWTSAGGALSVPTLGGTSTNVYAVNSSGVVVGRSADATDTLKPFRWTPADGIEDLGTLGGAGGAAFAINASGAIVGTAQNGGGSSVAFRWTSGGGMTSLGLLSGGDTSFATAVSDNGIVAGWSTVDGGARHVFTWTSDGGMVDLGTPSGLIVENVVGVSSAGAVVFNARDDDSGYTRAYYYAGGTMTDLSGAIISAGLAPDTDRKFIATGFNDAGQIVGYVDANDIDRGTAFMVTVSAVPEPSTYAALAGVAALGLVAWRRRKVRD